MDITQTLGSGEKSKFLPAIASFTLRDELPVNAHDDEFRFNVFKEVQK